MRIIARLLDSIRQERERNFGGVDWFTEYCRGGTAVERNLLRIRGGKEDIMLSSPRADRYWKSSGGEFAGRPDGYAEGLMEIGNKRACVRRSDMVW